MTSIELSLRNFQSVISDDELVMCLFWSPDVPDCRAVTPLVDEIAREAIGLTVGKLDASRDAELAARFGVSELPAVVVYRAGKELGRLCGVHKKEEYLRLL